MNIKERQAAAKARAIIESWYITDPSQIDVYAIAADAGAYVVERPLKGCEGRLLRRGNHGVVTIRPDIREHGKKRFVAAHELGHFVLHKKANQIELCTDEALLYWYKHVRREEPESNAFAAELLLPAHLFQPLCKGMDPSMDAVKELADVFQTTLTATARRYANLSPHACALVVSRNGKIEWFDKHEDFLYRVKQGCPVHPHTYAADFFAGRPLSDEPHEVLAEVWLEDERIGSRETLMEHSVALPFYNVVLSLIWIAPGSSLDRLPDDEDEDELDELTGDLKFKRR